MPFPVRHITQLVAGDEIKVVVSTLHQYNIRHTKAGPILVAGVGRNTRGKTRTILYGRVSNNQPTEGQLSMDVHYDRSTILPATVKYNTIRHIHQIVRHDGIVETATRPGGVAKGTALLGGMLSQPSQVLNPVKF